MARALSLVRWAWVVAASSVVVALVACGTSTPASVAPEDGGVPESADQADKARVDGGFQAPDGEVLPTDRFVTKIVHFAPGPCAGFGADAMPEVVLGPPIGGGSQQGSLDVVSLGIGGEIVLSFEPGGILDGAGADFIVFENPFYAGGNAERPVADLGEVSVSEDGTHWKTYACTPGDTAPYGKCAGWHPVYSAPGNGISPVDPASAGGDSYDLSELGLSSARFVRIRDMSTATCEGKPKPTTAGFDLDAVSIVHPTPP